MFFVIFRDLEKHKSDEMETDFFDDNQECVSHVRKMVQDSQRERYAIQSKFHQLSMNIF